MTTISNALKRAANQLSNSASSNLDAEVLLAHTLDVTRSYFFAHPSQELTRAEEMRFNEFMQRKLNGEPTAYIIGQREFWSLNFSVSKDTLIPRPETELLVEQVLKEFGSRSGVTLADLGTGCGAIALALAHEKPDWQIIATDLRKEALAVAKTNAQRLNLKNVFFQQGNWCEALPPTLFDVIISNPPYVEMGDKKLQKEVLQFEPHTAFLAEENGLADLRSLINSAKQHLKPGGVLYLEHGATQAEMVNKLFREAGYDEIKLYKDYADLDRVTGARFTFCIAS